MLPPCLIALLGAAFSIGSSTLAQVHPAATFPFPAPSPTPNNIGWGNILSGGLWALLSAGILWLNTRGTQADKLHQADLKLKDVEWGAKVAAVQAELRAEQDDRKQAEEEARRCTKEREEEMRRMREEIEAWKQRTLQAEQRAETAERRRIRRPPDPPSETDIARET